MKPIKSNLSACSTEWPEILSAGSPQLCKDEFLEYLHKHSCVAATFRFCCFKSLSRFQPTSQTLKRLVIESCTFKEAVLTQLRLDELTLRNNKGVLLLQESTVFSMFADAKCYSLLKCRVGSINGKANDTLVFL